MTVLGDANRAYEPFADEVVEDTQPAGTTPCQWALRVAMLLAYVAMIAGNAIDGSKIGTTSHEFPTRITPAGYAFMIWTPIFIATFVFVIYAFVNRGPSNTLSPCVVFAVILNFLCNGIWSFVFTNKLGVLSAVILVCIAVTNWKIYSFVNPKGASAFPVWSWNYWCRKFAWSIYTPWTVVASLLNIIIAQEMAGVSLPPKDQNIEGIAFITMATFVGLYWTVRREDIVAVGVLLWAFIAIAVAQTQYMCTFTAAVAASGMVFAFVLLTVLRRVTGTERV